MNIPKALYQMRDDTNAYKRRKFKFRLNEAYVRTYAVKVFGNYYDDDNILHSNVQLGDTFYVTTVAIVNLVKYRKLGSPVMSMTKIISMAAALVSMLSLETAMFSAFGEDMSPENQRLMIMLTGAGVSIIIVSMSVYSIVKNSKEIRKIMENNDYAE